MKAKSWQRAIERDGLTGLYESTGALSGCRYIDISIAPILPCSGVVNADTA